MSEHAHARTGSELGGAPDRPRCRTQDIDCQKLDHELLVIDAAADRVHFLNASMAAVWSLCDGTHAVDQIAQGLAETFDCSQAGDLDDTVREALTTLADLDLLTKR